MPNTEFHYMYRDSSNYKQPGVVTFVGEITDEQRATITAALDEGTYFLADQVGVPNMREAWSTHYESDHIWHEFTEFLVSEAAPTGDETIADFAARFAGIEWDTEAAERQLEAWVYVTPQGH